MRSIGNKSVGRMAAVAALALTLLACSRGATATSGSGGSKGGSSTAMTIGTQQVKGIGTVLDTAEGLTLYYNTQETGGKIVCTGSCEGAWPPVLVSGALPAVPGGVTGSFGTIVRPDGSKQLTFDGKPLYTYAGDNGPGQANGQGLQGVWYAVTTSASGSGAGSGSASGSGYSRY
ncbi:MAG TPA: hypothetical protein VFC04_07800 [Actinomycetota bacterium]|jgi:predicted lipoprotein with Yx(FWY)xxD motif|nr:hypothetical protein [Actinomycetota bacterium]